MADVSTPCLASGADADSSAPDSVVAAGGERVAEEAATAANSPTASAFEPNPVPVAVVRVPKSERALRAEKAIAGNLYDIDAWQMLFADAQVTPHHPPPCHRNTARTCG